MSGPAARYDQIGHGYATTRRPDPRLVAAVDAALDEATSVVNVGAGTGSYEPPHRRVVAVEPSRVMLAQRPPGSAPAVQAVAEALPFADGAFDAATALQTLHHRRDADQGLRELRRVARRVVVLTRDPAFARDFWLTCDYLPENPKLDVPIFRPVPRLVAALGGRWCSPSPSHTTARTASSAPTGGDRRPTSTLGCGRGSPPSRIRTRRRSGGAVLSHAAVAARAIPTGSWDRRP